MHILIAVLAVVLALVLLVVGGVALFGALTSKGTAPSSQATDAASNTSIGSAKAGSGNGQSTNTAARQALVIRVTGAPTKVIITVRGSGQVLVNRQVSSGETVQYDQTPLDVVVIDGGAVDVFIHGKQQPKGAPGQRAQWYVPTP